MIVTVLPLLGIPELHGWAGTLTLQQDTFVFLVSISGSYAESVGLDLQAEFADSVVATADDFYELLQAVTAFVQKKAVDISYASLFLLDDSTVFLATHNGTILLKRGSTVGQALVNTRQQLAMITGVVHAEDTFVFLVGGAQEFQESVEQQLRNGYDTESVVATITPLVHAAQSVSTAGLNFVTVQEKFSAVTPPIAEEKLVEPVATSSVFLSKVRSIIRSMFAFTKWRIKSPQLLSIMPLKQQKSPHIKAAYIMVAIALLAGGFFWWRTQDMQRQSAERLVAEVMQKIESAKKIVDSQPVAARDLAMSAQGELQALQQKFAEQAAGLQVIKNAQQQVDTYVTEISGREELQELPVWIDLRQTFDTFVATAAETSTGFISFLDTEQKQLIAVTTADKTTKSSTLETITALPKAITGSVKQIYILADGVWQFDRTGGKISQVIAAGDSNKQATLLAAFSDYLYIFNPEKRNIFRYASKAPKSEGFSEPIGWLQDKQGLPFSDIVSWAIDGDIWLATKTGQILKYSQGQPQKFIIEGLPDAFGSPIELFTGEDFQHLYVLESAHNRLVILDKEGNFIRQIKSTSLATTRLLLVSPDEKTIFVVSGSLVYQINL